MNELAPRQREAVIAIHEYVHRHGYAPSRVEIAQALGTAATHYVHEIIEALVLKGAITREKYTARSIALTNKGRAMAGLT